MDTTVLKEVQQSLSFAVAEEDDSVEGLFQHCFLSLVFVFSPSFLHSTSPFFFISASLFLPPSPLFSSLRSPSLSRLFPPPPPSCPSVSPAFIGQRPCAGNGQFDNVCRGMIAVTYAP